MYRVFNAVELATVVAVSLVTYKVVELGPYEATLLLGRCLHIFIAAAQGLV